MLISDSALIDEERVMNSINSLLSMFEIVKQPTFPRKIMTADYIGSFDAYDIDQLYTAFKRAHFKDCRISAYPSINKNDKDIIQFAPNILLLDLDLDHKIMNLKSKQAAEEALRNKVNKIIARLQQVYKIYNFMVLWTGNGRHVIVPFGFSRPFEHLTEFSKYLDLLPNTFSISENFLEFAKKFLSNNQADTANHPNFQSMFLRVPGTLNTKKKYSNISEVVKIEHEWELTDDDLLDYPDLHPSTDLIYEFMGYLDDKALEYRIREDQNKSSLNSQTYMPTRNAIPWIETLWRTPVSDCRKRIIWLILTRYVINTRKMNLYEALNWIKQWLILCDRSRSTSEITDEYIRYYLDLAKTSEYNPLSFNTLKEYDWKLADESSLYSAIKNKMNRQHQRREVKNRW